MYLPRHFEMGELDEVAAFVERVGSADLVTAAPDGRPESTVVPLLWDRSDVDPGAGRYGRIFAHVARMNEQWTGVVDGQRALAIVHGPQAYVSPSWYAAKSEHGRVVPTWNYVTAHVYGSLVIHDDPVWLEALVRRLTDRHERASERPWTVDDAPPRFVQGQLRAIVGVEVVISRVEAKLKLSQNRPAADIDGVIAGLKGRGQDVVATAVADARPQR